LYDKEIILSNPKATVKSKKRYLEKELSKLLGGYNKNKLHFEKFEQGIKDAVSRAKELSVDNLTIIDELAQAFVYSLRK
jgi:succinylglutamate desuccinylase